MRLTTNKVNSGLGKSARKVLEEVRRRHKIPRASQTKMHQAWMDEAMAGDFRPGSAVRLRQIAAKARSSHAQQQWADKSIQRRDEVRTGKVKPLPAAKVYHRIERSLGK
jgi:hypothetical protein